MIPPGSRLLVGCFLMFTTSAVAQSPPLTQVLAVQDAHRQGRELVSRGKFREAVDLLEPHVPHVAGNAAFLSVLREAYAGLVKELQLANRPEASLAAQRKLNTLEQWARQPAATVARATPAAQVPPTTARGVRGEEPPADPFQQVPLAQRDNGLLAADQAFMANQYAEAGKAYAQAATSLTTEQRARWAYCRINAVVERTNAGPTPAEAATLEAEMTDALAADPANAPLQQFGQQVLGDLRKWQTPFTVKHSPRNADNWCEAASPNFHLYHDQSKELAERVLQVAETARREAFARWTGQDAAAWAYPCQIVLYNKAAHYAKATGKDAASPGHSTIKAQAGKVVARRVEFHPENPNFLPATVPHEVTHVVLGDLFPDGLPRWADEGMAVLAEPRSQVDRYRRTLQRCRAESRLLSVPNLLADPDYPDAASITAFFVESVSLVEFLVGEKGPQTFVQFLRDNRAGTDAALAKHYGFTGGAAQLQDRWLLHTFPQVAGK